MGTARNQPDSLPARVRALAREAGLWSPGGRVLVAISGGADSVALLHVLAGLAGAESLELCAAHVNYGLRGPASDADESCCHSLCEMLGVPLYVLKAPVPPRGNLQAWARRLRQKWFAELAREHACDCIAMGHTANDRAETVVLQWLRGAARRGAANMRPKQGRVIRPLLTTTRTETESYLRAQGVAFCTDATNATPRYRRNRVRHEVLPLLSDVFEVDAVAALSESADVYGLEADFLDIEARKHLHFIEPAPGGFRIAAAPLLALHPAMTLHLLKFALERLGVRPGRNHLFRLLKLAGLPAGRRLRLGSRVTAEKGRDHLWLYTSARALAEVEVHVPGVTALPDGSRLLVEPFTRNEPYPPGDFRIAAALSDTRTLHLRPAHAGDRIHPFGSRGTRLVFDLLSEAGVPRYLRTRSWVLEEGTRILWLLGHRPAEETRVLPDSREIYQFRWETGESRESAS